MQQKFFNALDQARNSSTITRATTAALVLGAGGAASAQTGAEAAVTGLGLEGMVSSAGEGIRQVLSANAGPLVLALLPVMGFFFIWGRIRSLF